MLIANADLIIRIAIVSLLTALLLFSLLVARQVFLLNRFLETKSGKSLHLLTLLYTGVVLAVLILTVFLVLIGW